MEGLLLKQQSRAFNCGASFSTKSCFIPHAAHTHLTSSLPFLNYNTLRYHSSASRPQLKPLVLWASEDHHSDGFTEEDEEPQD
eukprot:c20584_g1_i1 orf=52-300(+)